MRSLVTAKVYQTAAQDSFEKCALLGKLADCAGLSLLRMNVDLRAGNIQVSAEEQRCARRLKRPCVLFQRL
jgi:hypothetical protein